jgi:hypothetical protein
MTMASGNLTSQMSANSLSLCLIMFPRYPAQISLANSSHALNFVCLLCSSRLMAGISWGTIFH